jgi:hypothetical protein
MNFGVILKVKMNSKEEHQSKISKCSSEEGKVCSFCGEFPCIWYDYEESIVETSNDMIALAKTADGCPPKNNIVRKEGYKCFVRMHYGHLGVGNRQEIPACVLNHIRALYPDDNGAYMGFKSE